MDLTEHLRVPTASPDTGRVQNEDTARLRVTEPNVRRHTSSARMPGSQSPSPEQTGQLAEEIEATGQDGLTQSMLCQGNTRRAPDVITIQLFKMVLVSHTRKSKRETGNNVFYVTQYK